MTPRKIIYNWKYRDYPGDSNVSFELFEEGKCTKLKLTHTVLSDFPEDIPEFSRESCLAGWKYFISGRLKEYVAGKMKGDHS